MWSAGSYAPAVPRLEDQAVVLRVAEYSESSQIVALLGRRVGRFRGLARGSTRVSPSSVARFSGGLWLCHIGGVTASTGGQAELASITGWDLLRDHWGLRTSFTRQAMAMMAVELVDAMLPEFDPHPHVYDWLAELLDGLADPAPEAPAGDATHRAALLRFLWRVLDAAGYRPDLDADIASGEALPADATTSFRPGEGGFTADRGVTQWRVRASTRALLRGLADEATRAQPVPLYPAAEPADAATVERALRLLGSYTRILLDRELHAMRAVLGDVGGA